MRMRIRIRIRTDQQNIFNIIVGAINNSINQELGNVFNYNNFQEEGQHKPPHATKPTRTLPQLANAPSHPALAATLLTLA